MKESKLRYDRILITIAVVAFLLYKGAVLFIPLFFGLFISCIIYPICKKLENRGISKVISILIGMLIIVIPFVLICLLFIYQLISIGKEWTFISHKFQELFREINLPDQFQISLEQKKQWLQQAISNVFSGLFSGIVSSAVTTVQVIMVPFYAVLILFHRRRLVKVLYLVFPITDENETRKVLSETIVAYYNFVKGMAIVYLVVGILNSLGLFFLGIPNAVMFGFIASILTFIPYVGIMIGAILPISFAWAIHGNIFYPLGVVAVFTFIQILEANFIFPLAVSSKIKVNTLVTIIAIFLGGIIWGAAGMILFIPFLAILKLISERVDKLKPICVLIGNNSEDQ